MKRNVKLAWPLIFGFLLALVGAAIYLGSIAPLMNAQAERDDLVYRLESAKADDSGFTARQQRHIEGLEERLSEFDEGNSLPRLTLINHIGIVVLVIGSVASISTALASRAISEEP